MKSCLIYRFYMGSIRDIGFQVIIVFTVFTIFIATYRLLVCMDCDNCLKKFKGNCANFCEELKKEREMLKATDPVRLFLLKFY